MTITSSEVHVQLSMDAHDQNPTFFLPVSDAIIGPMSSQ
jgi:hypothetical protein